MKDSKKMIDAEISFMKRNKAPKKMIKHEMDERAGMKKYKDGGSVRGCGAATKGKKFSGVY